MSPYFAASMLAAQLAAAPAVTKPTVQEAEIATDWASPKYDARATRIAIREIVAESSANEEAAAAQRFSAGPRREQKYEQFARDFDEAEVPGCLGPNALKHQPPKIGPIGLGGILALPFLVVAAARGKCK
jgi:hypothetical protein